MEAPFTFQSEHKIFYMESACPANCCSPYIVFGVPRVRKIDQLI